MTKHRKSSKPPGDYTVGYRRTPVSTRFQPRTSGNKSGRPKGQKSPLQLLESIMKRRITIQINGKTKTITSEEALYEVLKKEALQGKASSQKILLTLLEKLRNARQPEAENKDLDAEDRALLEAFEAMLKGQDEPAAPNDDSNNVPQNEGDKSE